MITDAFDETGEEIIAPGRIAAPVEGFPETVAVTFSHTFNELFLRSFDMEEISRMNGGRIVPIYAFSYGGKRLGFYHTLLGGSASAGLLEEAIAKGAKKVLFFGSCGSLDREITAGHFIVPTAAYRDEGTSYHYAPPGDYLDIPTADRLAEIFDALGIRYTKARTWTTDGFYRETRKNTETRKSEGCAVVEMECASVMAVGQLRGTEVYQFLYAADCLDEKSWDRRILGSMPEDMREGIMKIVLETAVRL